MRNFILILMFGILAFNLSAQREPDTLTKEEKQLITQVKQEQEIQEAKKKLRKYGFASITRKGIKAQNAIDSLIAISQTLQDPELIATFQSVIEAAKDRPKKGDPAGDWIAFIANMIILILTSVASVAALIRSRRSGFGLFGKKK